MLEAADGLELSADVKVLGDAEEVLDAGMRVIVAAKDQLGLLNPESRAHLLASVLSGRHQRRQTACAEIRKGLLVWSVDVPDRQDGQIPVVSKVAQCNLRAWLDGQLVDLRLVHIEGDGHAEEQAVFEAVLLDHSGSAVLAKTCSHLFTTLPHGGSRDIPVVIVLSHETCAIPVSVDCDTLSDSLPPLCADWRGGS